MFGILAFILFVIAAILGWTGSEAQHVLAIIAAGLAALTAEVVFAWRPWVHP
ncbi:MAG TPA: hypothetical protein VHE33_10435 [Acidobacteriaceae bacterium]|nr:hypothetical protein [Acidobacteriaceae bacterium]